MSLDVYLIKEGETVYSDNITHNLNKMASEAGIYEALWRPEEINAIIAKDLIMILEKGIFDLKSRRQHFEKFNASNGWGKYDNLLDFATSYFEACKENPETIIYVSR